MQIPAEHMQNIFGSQDAYIRKIEDELHKFQREVFKEIEESNLPRTESFYNFGKKSKKDLGQEKE